MFEMTNNTKSKL